MGGAPTRGPSFSIHLLAAAGVTHGHLGVHAFDVRVDRPFVIGRKNVESAGVMVSNALGLAVVDRTPSAVADAGVLTTARNAPVAMCTSNARVVVASRGIVARLVVLPSIQARASMIAAVDWSALFNM
jgi:hypothetical protein